MRFFVTFPIGGPLRNCYTIVEAATELAARLVLMDEYGREGWAGIYREHEYDRAVGQYGLHYIPFGPVAS